MLEEPAAEIGDVIHWFGSRNKIFNFHYRNIRGRRLSFMEVFPDEGDIDMWTVLKELAAVGYKHMVMPDHVPTLSADPGHAVAFAYCFGYVRAMMQVLATTTPEAVEL
jgi:mannonate dehydratase